MPNDGHEHGNGGGQPPVTFTIDGVPYTLQDRHQTAASLLTLAGSDPAEDDLARVEGHGQQHRLADTEPVEVTPGARFVTIYTGSLPVA